MDFVEIFTQISILIGIIVAIYNIGAWRREHVGRRQLELAEDTLALFYEAADAVRHMRSSFGFGHETEDVEQAEGETDERYEARKKASVVFHRYNQHQAIFSKLHASRYRFMAQIGVDETQPFDDIRKITNEVISSARMLAQLWAQTYFRTEEQEHDHWNRIGKYEAVFWEGLEDNDPINPKLDKVVNDIEMTCKPIIAGKGTLHGFLSFNLWKRR